MHVNFRVSELAESECNLVLRSSVGRWSADNRVFIGDSLHAKAANGAATFNGTLLYFLLATSGLCQGTHAQSRELKGISEKLRDVSDIVSVYSTICTFVHLAR